MKNPWGGPPIEQTRADYYNSAVPDANLPVSWESHTSVANQQTDKKATALLAFFTGCISLIASLFAPFVGFIIAVSGTYLAVCNLDNGKNKNAVSAAICCIFAGLFSIVVFII